VVILGRVGSTEGMAPQVEKACSVWEMPPLRDFRREHWPARQGLNAAAVVESVASASRMPRPDLRENGGIKTHLDWHGLYKPWLPLVMAVAVAGCAGATVAPEFNAQPVRNSRPSTIYVYPFAVSASDVTLNQGSFQPTYGQFTDSNQNQSQLEVAHQTASVLADSMVQQLQALGFTASRVARGTQVSGENVVIVDGEFLDINQCKRLHRMVIGLGVGEATLDSQVQAYQMANRLNQQLMEFNVHVNSGQMPGTALTMPAGAATGSSGAAVSPGGNLAAGTGETYTSSTIVMAQRSAKQAVAYMSQYFASQGWIPQTMVQAADTNSSATPGLLFF
jgi:hypothetical protein